VLCLISGGASALMPLPVLAVSLAEKQETTRLLLACGATIHEINAVRKHLSQVKGGQLARLAFPSRVVSLILSDVVGDDLDVIGSGPTAPDLSTFATARAVLQKFLIWDSVPRSVQAHLTAAAAETPKPGDPLFARVTNHIAGSNRVALAAAADEAQRLGYRPVVLTRRVEGEAQEVAKVLTAIARDVKPPACVISGGETTVTLTGKGKGGRNQEFALSAAVALKGVRGITVLSAGTDGSDGPTDAAGAIADGSTIERDPDGLHHLLNHDAYPYFARLGDLIITGPTGTNVMDIQLFVVTGDATSAATDREYKYL
jgi:glycerate 2-kinase